MSTQYFHYIQPPSHFPYNLPPSTDTSPQTGPVLPSCSPFFRGKNLFKIALQEVSLWHLYVYIYIYIHISFICIYYLYILYIGSCPLYFSFLPYFLMVTSTGLKILCSFLYRKQSSIFTFLTSSFHPPWMDALLSQSTAITK
jgi:hypothetical protein